MNATDYSKSSIDVTPLNPENKTTDIKPAILDEANTDLHIIDGMRVLCLMWIMTLGVCSDTMSSASKNPWTLQHYFTTYGYTAVYSSNLGFDEFFFLASLLLTVKLQEYLKSHQFTVGSYFKLLFARYARLAPFYYLVFLFGWQVGPFLANGPCWFTYDKGYSNCD